MLQVFLLNAVVSSSLRAVIAERGDARSASASGHSRGIATCGEVASPPRSSRMTGRAESLSASPRRQFAPNLFHSATAMRSRLKVWNESGTKRARIADSSRDPIRSPQHLALAALGAALDQVCTGSTSGGVRVKSLKARSRIRSGQESSRIHAGCTARPCERGCAPSRRLTAERVGVRGSLRESRPRRQPLTRIAARSDLSPRRTGRGARHASIRLRHPWRHR